MKTFVKSFVLVFLILELVVFSFSIYKMILDEFIHMPIFLFLGFLCIILIEGIYYIIKNWRKL